MKRTWTIQISVAIITYAALSLTACSGLDTPAPAGSPGSGSTAASAPISPAGGATTVSATALRALQAAR
ncbi:MAG: hypothetical protein QOE61_179 [Micromonosporaceae bacterium]|nr:hypothetical protein [Micromonosporaceae bacterium]